METAVIESLTKRIRSVQPGSVLHPHYHHFQAAISYLQTANWLAVHYHLRQADPELLLQCVAIAPSLQTTSSDWESARHG